jgi:hypothetical protein
MVFEGVASTAVGDGKISIPSHVLNVATNAKGSKCNIDEPRWSNSLDLRLQRSAGWPLLVGGGGALRTYWGARYLGSKI